MTVVLFVMVPHSIPKKFFLFSITSLSFNGFWLHDVFNPAVKLGLVGSRLGFSWGHFSVVVLGHL